MKKVILFVVLFVGLIFSIFGQSVNEFRIREENGGITITGYWGSVKNVVIPEKINGLPVVAIGESAFRENHLTSITLPNSLTSIGDRAFIFNKLTSITFPNSLTTIGERAFAGNKLTSITFPNSLTIIGDWAFNENQLTSITLSNSLTSIGNYAFSDNHLTSITLPNSLTFIGSYAFSMNKLTSVVVPRSVVYLGSNAFDRNVNIARGQTSTSNQPIDRINERFFTEFANKGSFYKQATNANQIVSFERSIYKLDINEVYLSANIPGSERRSVRCHYDSKTITINPNNGEIENRSTGSWFMEFIMFTDKGELVYFRPGAVIQYRIELEGSSNPKLILSYNGHTFTFMWVIRNQ